VFDVELHINSSFEGSSELWVKKMW